MSRFSQGPVGPRCNRTDSAIQSGKMREYSFKWWWWVIIFLCHHLWQPKKSRKIHSPPVLSRPLWFAVGIWQRVDRVGFRRGQGGPRWCPYRLPSTRGGSLAPRSKCLLVGVECLAGKVRPFEACVCVSVHARFYWVKITVAGQVGVSIGHHSGQRCVRTGQRRRARSQVHWPAWEWEWVSLRMVQPGHLLDVPSHPHLLISQSFLCSDKQNPSCYSHAGANITQNKIYLFGLHWRWLKTRGNHSSGSP